MLRCLFTSTDRHFKITSARSVHRASTLGIFAAITCLFPAQTALAQQFQRPVLPGEATQNGTVYGMTPSNRLGNAAYPQVAEPTFAQPAVTTASIPATNSSSGTISKSQSDSRQASYNTFAPPVHIQPSSTAAAPVQVQYRKFSDQTELTAQYNTATPPRRPAVDSIYKAPIQSLKTSVNNGQSTSQRMLIAKSSPTPSSRTEVQRRRPSTAASQKPPRENAIAKFQNQITNFLYTPAVPSQRLNNRPSSSSRSARSSQSIRSNGRSAPRRSSTYSTATSQPRRASSAQQRYTNDRGVQHAYSRENSANLSTSVQNAVQQVTMVAPTQDPFNDESVELPPSERIVVEQTLGRFEPGLESDAGFQQAEAATPKPDPSTMSQISVLNRGNTPISSSIATQDNQAGGGFKKPTQDPAIEELPAPNPDFDFGGNQRPSTSSFQNCDEFRAELLEGSIKDIALDLSPLPGRNRSLYQTESRDWIDRDGNVVATGTMIDLRRGYVIIESEQGTEKIPYAKLSDADWATISQFWQIPELCSAGNQGSAARNWLPQTYAWQASALCHKPLYFENVQLERYGHSHGPLRQPIHSVAHFFVSLVTVPYQTGIHPVNECQYALGFYRPGDCAPWLKDPIPFSLNGAVRQALVTTGVAVIP